MCQNMEFGEKVKERSYESIRRHRLLLKKLFLKKNTGAQADVNNIIMPAT